MIKLPFFHTGDPNAVMDGISLSYDPVYGIDNKTALEFIWECQTFDTVEMEDLVEISSLQRWENGSSDCDYISTEDEIGKRQLQVPDDVDAVGYMFKVDTV